MSPLGIGAGETRRRLRGARGQASQACTREAPAKPSAGITTGCLRWLDAAATKGGGSCPDRGPGSGLVAARKHGAGDLKGRDGAPRGALPLATEGTRLASVSGGRAGCPGGLASLRVSRRSAPLAGAQTD